RIVADRKQPAVDHRMQRLHAPVHDLGKARERGDVENAEPVFRKQGRRAAGGGDLHVSARQGAGEIHDTRLVGDRNQGAAPRHEIGNGKALRRDAHLRRSPGRWRGWLHLPQGSAESSYPPAGTRVSRQSTLGRAAGRKCSTICLLRRGPLKPAKKIESSIAGSTARHVKIQESVPSPARTRRPSASRESEMSG